MMNFPKIKALLFLLLITGSTVFSQELVFPAEINTALLTHPDKRMLKSRVHSEAKDGDLLTLPFIDDFSTDRFPGNAEGRTPLWTSRNATRNTNMAFEPRSVGTVTFDGADAQGYPYNWSPGVGIADTLMSRPIDLTGDASSGIGISFFFQPKGNAVFGPTAGVDSLRLEFYAPELDQWFWVWSTVDVSEPEAFQFVYIPITQPRYLREDFQFRFRNFANLQGAFSVWNLDYVRIDQNNVNATPITDDVAFIRAETTLLDVYTEMPRSHFSAVSLPDVLMRESIEVRLRNLSATNRTMVGNEILIKRDGIPEAMFPNENSPAIMAGSVLDYTHAVFGAPNEFVFDVDEEEGPLDFEVNILHGVQDIEATSSNDTIRFTQRFFTDYAYDDGSAEWAYAVAGNGSEVAVQFTALAPGNIVALKIYTMPFGNNYEGTPITLMIYEDTGNGPGAVIAEELSVIEYGIEEYQQSIIYAFEEPVPMPAGSFFVGYRQSAQQNGIRVGLDRNTNANADHLWFNDASQVWNQSLIEGSVMIRPMFDSPGWEDLIVSAKQADPGSQVTLYPNPAAQWFTADFPESSPYEAEVYDISGRLVKRIRMTSGEQISAADLQNGLYILRFTSRSGDVFTKKITVRH